MCLNENMKMEILTDQSELDSNNVSNLHKSSPVNISNLLTEQADCYSSSRDPSTPIFSTWMLVLVSMLFVLTSVVVVLANVAVIGIHFCASSSRIRLNITRYLCYLAVADMIKGKRSCSRLIEDFL